MPKKVVEFDGAESKFYIEAELPQSESGFASAEPGAGMPQKITKNFSDSLQPVLNFTQTFVNSIENIKVSKPTSVELEFGIKLSGKLDFWVVSGTGEGSISMKLVWNSKQ